MMVGFAFVNYNNSSFTARLLHSLSHIDQADQCHTVVVDNHSSDADRQNLILTCGRYRNVSPVLNQDNVGYFRGLNRGIARLREMFPEMAYIVVGNNDLEFGPDIVSSILRKHDVFERHAVVAPDIIRPDGSHQNPHVIKPITWPREILYDAYYLNYHLGRLIRGLNHLFSRFTRRTDHLNHATPMEIFQGYGACYVLGPVFLRHFTELWAPTFLMSEEYFLARQLRDKNLSQFYEPSIRVYHYGRATTRHVPRREMWRIARASHRVYRQHKTRFGHPVPVAARLGADVAPTTEN